MTNYGHGIKSPRKRPTIKTPCGCDCGCQGYALTAYKIPEGGAVRCASCTQGTHHA